MNFIELVRADHERAMVLSRSLNGEALDAQFRIATPKGDYWIGITLGDAPGEQVKRLNLVSAWMRAHEAQAFTLAIETITPDAIVTIGVGAVDVVGFLTEIGRTPYRLGDVEPLAREAIDPALLWRWKTAGGDTPHVASPAERDELEIWFGVTGRFPAIGVGQQNAAQAGALH